MVRIGIVGCGQIAQHHMSTYSRLEDAKMVAFCDVAREVAERSAQAYGVENVYTDFHEMLKRDDIDAIDVCLHNNFHMPVTVAGLKAGKHVYCEKPMAGSYKDAATMLETARQTGKKLHIQLAQLYSNETRAAKELIDSGELGTVYHARSTGFRRRGRPFVDGYGTPSFVQSKNSAGGALYDMGVYHISQCLYLLGNPNVERVSGKTYQKVAIDAKRLAESNYDVEELGLGLVRMERDISLDLIEAWAVNLDGMEGSSILGSDGGVRLNPFGFFKNVGSLELNSTANLGAARSRWDTVLGIDQGYADSQAHWISALEDRVKLLPTAEVALNTMLISEGVYLSQRLNREVTAAEIVERSVSTAVSV